MLVCETFWVPPRWWIEAWNNYGKRWCSDGSENVSKDTLFGIVMLQFLGLFTEYQLALKGSEALPVFLIQYYLLGVIEAFEHRQRQAHYAPRRMPVRKVGPAELSMYISTSLAVLTS
jgi:hypothetical protein